MEKDDANNNASQKRKQIFDSLDKEMEIAEYSTSETGQRRRKVPRAEGAIRNQKRKILEKKDHQELSMEGDTSERLRGSRNALEDEVIHGSQVFAKDDDEEEEEEEEEEDVEEDVEESDEEMVEEVDDDDEEEGTAEVEVAKASGAATRPAAAAQGKKKTRLMYRMRNFKSARMAERHGDALGAHARGHSLTAVRKLEQVAVDAPTAPQVYSSLGMVYESLLSDSRKKQQSVAESEENTIKSIERQLELAKKAYGSYHVAALLCKKDFSLWVRAGDTAKEISDLYTEIMELPDTHANKQEGCRDEKRKWTEEAKKDYLAADNQRPPGIDVPAKLAAAHMELGNLSDALVILTDLKNRSAADDDTHNEFEKSYKAWLLYADLMLRIGYECIQWNNGNQRNENYMFRRWLRKWSDSFDWKERRLQALVQALEAAAGSKCCESVIAWSKKRAENAASGQGNSTSADQRRWHVDLYEVAKDPPAAKQAEAKQGDEADEDTADRDKSPLNTTVADDSSAWSLDRAREALLNKNQLELKVFDEETKKMGLEASQERANARDALVASHRRSVVDLVGNYHQHHATIVNAIASNLYERESGGSPKATEPLPITASCASVCSIASELMKHCLRFELFEGARLVGEAVSAYLKERAELLERRIESNRAFAERQKSTAESVLLSIEAYDEVGEDESEDDADAIYLSDDEVILESSDEQLIPSLKNGILPPELRLLYALSLIAEGGKSFLARQYMKAIEFVEPDDLDALISDPVDTHIVKDPLWYGFRQELTEPLQRTAAFAFAIDILQKANKEAEYADLMTPLLKKHLEDLESTGQMDIALFGSEAAAVSKLAVSTRKRVIKLILASARMQIERAKVIAPAKKSEVIECAMSVLGRVIPLLQKFWKVEANGSIPSFCVEGIELLTRSFALLTSLSQDSQVEPRVFGKLLETLSLLCGAAIQDPLSLEVSDDSDLFKDSATYPIKADWQNISQILISKRLYNITIGCLVSHFSGWEADEFSLDLLRTSQKDRHFAVNIRGERVTGSLSPSTEADLANQWTQISKLVPQFASFDFKTNLDKAKASSWYKETIEGVDASVESLSSYGEKDAFELFLTMSRLCLQAASTTESSAKQNALIKLALSVILPLSEFCLNMNLWDAPVGKAAITKTVHMYDWNKLAKSVGQQSDTGVAKRPKARQQPLKRTEPAPAKKRPLPTMIRIPVSTLLCHWNNGAPTKRNDSDEAREAMRKVDESIKQLRACYTETAVQKGCSQVALALMGLVVKGFAYNPFLCLQQAAIFAAQGSKGGNNDDDFKAGLPRERECTPQEALVIIGRADCLQSLHFPDEAIYLCSYVARVCRLHRDREEVGMEWNAQWKVVAICLYNLSVAIRTTRSFQEGKSVPENWDDSVVEELKHGRIDALAIKSTLPEVAAVTDHERETESNEEEADNFDDNGDIAHVVGGSFVDSGGVEMMETDIAYTFEPNGMLPSSGVGGAFDSDDDDEREIVAV